MWAFLLLSVKFSLAPWLLFLFFPLSLPSLSLPHENVTQRKVESSGFLLTEGEHRSLSLLYYVYHKNIGAPNVVCF